MSLEISFSCVSLRLGVSNFRLRGRSLGVSDFVFWPTVSIKSMKKIVYLIKNVR